MWQIDIAPEDLTEEEKIPCTGGPVFRAAVSTYMTNDWKIGHKAELRYLKRKSCQCNQCMILMDNIQEDIACDTLEVPADLEHGKLYTPNVEITGTDWETGYADDWRITFTEVKEEEQCT